MPKIHRFNVHPELPPRLRGLRELAYNLRWTWDADTYRLFRDLDPETLDRCGGNPVLLLLRATQERLGLAAGNGEYVSRVDEAIDDLHRYLDQPGWFQQRYPDRQDLCMAYFCMEYGLASCLPLYAGGLGVLAGDHLKSASGLDLPLVAVGLLYSRGYFTQRLDAEGWQSEEYRQQDLSTFPLRLVRAGETWRRSGERAAGGEPTVMAGPEADAGSDAETGPATDRDADPLKVALDIAGRTVWAQVWEAKVGRVSLYLLDSDLPENDHAAQRITGTLYGGDTEERLAQELLLGIGGMRALRALGARPDVCHLNEGHSVFSTLERIREMMHENGLTYHEARQAAGGGTLFTTHTPVSAGFDSFQEPLIETFMGSYLAELGLDTQEFMDMGRVHRDMPDEEFNVAVLALRHAPRRNAVSRLHRRTTARMMEPGWVDFPLTEMPIESVTNGVHTLSWVAPEMAEVYDRYLDPGWRDNASDSKVWEKVGGIPDEELWRVHTGLREQLVARVREQTHKQALTSGAGGGAGLGSRTPLRPDALTIGFARRFATYKRATLLLHDPARLKALLTDSARPVQLVLSGKAHPKDGAGKDLIREILETIRDEGLADSMVFVEDYDLRKAAVLVRGVDVWLNTPRRPFEASGTSGMKVVPNGGLNCSVLDGWWAEAFRPGVGWAIGDGQEFAHYEHQDAVDAESLYSVLEREVVPLFYERDSAGLPRGWITMMKESISVLAPAFSGERMLKQYAEGFYLPAADRFRFLSADNFAKAKEVSAWKFRVREAWQDVKVVWVGEQDKREVSPGEELEVTAKVQLGQLDPSEVTVEAYVGATRSDGSPCRGRGEVMEWMSCENGEHLYRGIVSPSTSGRYGYAVRVLPFNPEVLVPNELPLIAWEEE